MLEDLRKSISEMSDEELHASLREVRQSRSTPKASGQRVKARSEANNVPTKASVNALLGALSPEEKAKLMKDLLGE